MTSFRQACLFTIRSLASYAALLAAVVSLGWLASALDRASGLHFGPWASPDGVDGGPPLVVIDAGHGGHDGGAVANGLIEKNVTLELAIQVKEKLVAEGLRVEMTRTDDTFVSLEERSAFSARHHAAVFVSLHLNTSVDAPGVTGVETFYTTQKSSQPQPLLKRVLQSPQPNMIKDERGAALARILQKAVCHQAGAEDRGIKERRYAVVAHTACPAVLMECGFLTSTTEAARLKQEKYRDRIAKGVAQGVLAFVKIQRANPHGGMVPQEEAANTDSDAIAAAP